MAYGGTHQRIPRWCDRRSATNEEGSPGCGVQKSPDRRSMLAKGFVRHFLSTCDIFLSVISGACELQCNRAGLAGRRTVQGRATRMEGSGVVTITGRMLTIGGHQIETVTIATRRDGGRPASSTRRSRSHGIETSEPAQAANPAQHGFTYLRRRNFGLVSGGLAMYGAVGVSGSCLGSVAALAQGDGGEQRGACEQRGRQVQRIVQRAGEGRVPRLDDLV
jgi:hypothetical protein